MTFLLVCAGLALLAGAATLAAFAYKVFRGVIPPDTSEAKAYTDERIAALAKQTHDALTEVQARVQKIDNWRGGDSADRVLAAKKKPQPIPNLSDT